MRFKYSEYKDDKGIKFFRPTLPIVFKCNQPAILLGQKGFLENFRVTLDGKKRETEMHG